MNEAIYFGTQAAIALFVFLLMFFGLVWWLALLWILVTKIDAAIGDATSQWFRRPTKSSCLCPRCQGTMEWGRGERDDGS